MTRHDRHRGGSAPDRSHPDAPAHADPHDLPAPPREEESGGQGSETGAAIPGASTEPDAAELKDRWLRAEAELQNYRRRASREREESRRSAEDTVLRDVIAVADDFERALEAAPGEGVSEAWVAGVRLVQQRLLDALARHGVRPIDPGGQEFDPRFHEALGEVEAGADVTPGTVVHVVQKGYARGDRALRAARVLVARGAVAAGPR